MTRTLHLARHGETVWHADNRYAGSTDVALTEHGLEQAAALAGWAAGAGLALVASSDLTRARETAAPSAAAAGVPHTVDPRLREVDFGAGEGRTRDEMAAVMPEALQRFLAAPASAPLPGGEPGEAAATRFCTALGELSAAADGPVLVVAHNTAMRLALCRLLGVPLDDYRRRFPRVRNARITTVRLAAPGDVAAGTAELTAFDVDPF